VKRRLPPTYFRRWFVIDTDGQPVLCSHTEQEVRSLCWPWSDRRAYARVECRVIRVVRPRGKR
jgi:hypothetical protein